MRKCARCGREFQRLEGRINNKDYCHPDDTSLPDCYTLECRGATPIFNGWISL